MNRTLKDYPEISLKTEDLGEKIDFMRIFGRSGKIHIEIGSGKGTFLLNQAKAFTDDNFLGIEKASRFYRYSVDRIGRWALTNVRILHTDALIFLSQYVPDESVNYFHIYFPDPWPKKRHKKRRLICPENLEILIRCLKPDGKIQIATDHAEYFEQIKNVLSAIKLLELSNFYYAAGSLSGESVGTNFERKYIRENRKIYTIAVEKKIMNYHLAILKKPYLNAILTGRKTIESRFTKKRQYNSQKITVGDMIFLKESSGAVRATAIAAKVENFENLSPEKISDIKHQYNSKIGGPEQYWQQKQDCKSGFLVWLSEIKEINPVNINKKDWRAWVTLTKDKNFGLLDNSKKTS